MPRLTPTAALASALTLSCLSFAAHAQQALTCTTPASQLDSNPSTWSISAPVSQPNRTTPAPATPPTTGYTAAVAATPLVQPPLPPTDPDGYIWDPTYSWISMSATGASTHAPVYYFVRQQLNIDSTVNLASLALTYNVSIDDQLWAIYVNGVQVQAGSPLLEGFGPVDPATGYRTTQPLSVTLNSGWRHGLNEIVYAVYDFGGNMGFAAQATNVAINCTTGPIATQPPVAVPVNDWRALSLTGLLLAGLGYWRLRRRQA